MEIHTLVPKSILYNKGVFCGLHYNYPNIYIYIYVFIYISLSLSHQGKTVIHAFDKPTTYPLRFYARFTPNHGQLRTDLRVEKSGFLGLVSSR